MEEVLALVMMEGHSDVTYCTEEEVEVVVVRDSLKVQDLLPIAAKRVTSSSTADYVRKQREQRDEY